jgi:CBS-domain-containing membrane protein
MKPFGCSAVLILALLFSPFAQAQGTSDSTGTPNLFGSVTQGNPTPNSMALSIADAVDRALKYNLGQVLSQQETRISTANRLRSLAD